LPSPGGSGDRCARHPASAPGDRSAPARLRVAAGICAHRDRIPATPRRRA